MTQRLQGSRAVILALLRLQARRVWMLSLLALLLALSESVSVALLLPIANMMTQPAAEIARGDLSVWLMTSFGWDRQTVLLGVLAIFSLSLMVKAVATLANLYLLAAFGEVLRKDLAQRYLARYYLSDVACVSRANAMNATLQEAGHAAKLARDVIDLGVNLGISMAIVGVMVFINPLTFLLVIVFALISLMADRRYLRHLSIRLGNDRVRINQRITSRVHQLVEAIVEIRTLRLFEFARGYLDDAFVGYGRVVGAIATLRVVTSKVVELIIGLLFAAIAMTYLLIGEQIVSIGELGVIFVGMLRLGSNLSNVYGLVLSISNKIPSLDVFGDTLASDGGQQPPEVPARTLPAQVHIHELGGQVGHKLRIAITDFTIRKGEFNVIAGPSGVGKSTMCLILSGLHSADRFALRVDDLEYRDHSTFMKEMRVVYVPQENRFFDLTVEENLQLAVTSRGADAWEVLASVGMRDWVAEHTMDILGDGGLKPSIGQLRRLAFVRSVLSEPGLLILDEPTAGLDEQSELAVIDAIESLSQTCLILVVTHSPVLIARSRNIYTL
jgi:ABC-type bacteriocin/lantibiotic exporter with double-glycine peptidase domain